MANGGSLATKCKEFFGNVQLKGYDIYDVFDFVVRFKSFLENRGCDIWGMMLHDADLNEDGDFENIHVHFVYHVTDKNSIRLSTELNRIAKEMGVDTLAVSIGRNKSFEYAFQYFIHKPYPEKFQYPKEYIISNLSSDVLDAYLNADFVAMSEEYLIDVVARSYTRSDIVRQIGLYYYRCYRGIINDLWMEFHDVREVRERKRNGKEKCA